MVPEPAHEEEETHAKGASIGLLLGMLQKGNQLAGIG